MTLEFIAGRRWSLVLLLSLTLAACGGGGGGDDGDDPDDPPDSGNPPPDDDALNGGLTGKLFLDRADGYSELDLATGELRTLGRAESGRAGADGSEFSTWYDDSLAGGSGDDDIVVIDRDGAAITRFAVAEGLASTPRLSRDGSRLAAFWSSTGDARLTVFERDGTQVWQADAMFRAYDWLPDGGMVLIGDDETLYRVDADFGTPTELMSLAGEDPAFPSVSPSGDRILLTLGDRDSLANHVWVMNTDGSGLRQLTTSSVNEDGIGWSPDGEWVAVRRGIAYGGDGIPDQSCPLAVLVPADGEMVDVSAPQTGGAILVEHLDDGDVNASTCAFSAPEWRDVPTLETRSGTEPSGSGANQGLGGALTYFADGAPVSVALDSGVTTPIPVDDSYAYGLPSPDGSLLAYVQWDPDNGDSGQDQLTVQRFDGTFIGGFTISEDLEGYPKLSQDNSAVAVGWTGDPSADGVIAVDYAAGTPLGSFPNYSEWEWLPDGRLLLVADNRIDVSAPPYTATETLLTLPDPIGSLESSPDGSRLAFDMNHHIWTVNVDGSGLAPLTVSAAQENSPIWLADGAYVAFRHVAECSLVYVVPADGLRVRVTGAQSSALMLQRDDAGSLRNICANSRIGWMP